MPTTPRRSCACPGERTPRWWRTRQPRTSCVGCCGKPIAAALMIAALRPVNVAGSETPTNIRGDGTLGRPQACADMRPLFDDCRVGRASRHDGSLHVAKATVGPGRIQFPLGTALRAKRTHDASGAGTWPPLKRERPGPSSDTPSRVCLHEIAFPAPSQAPELRKHSRPCPCVPIIFGSPVCDSLDDTQDHRLHDVHPPAPPSDMNA